ncbi:Acetylxylan esterase precursor [Rosistilla oblonga]|uniref:alpha/beta hydrolase n=1 Tax=Rosistilla oblonga TaxID=2527990 RepID=UPI0011898977|nr:alpha/beta hydrolase [Rosistilla oblonga]QDV12535.1 Acetylxylan esterase precursor [Rosistilla oblonga]
MKLLASLVGCVFVICNIGSGTAAELETVRLWPQEAPGETSSVGPERQLPTRPQEEPNPIIRLTDIATPILTFYPAPEPASTGTTVIVCPGGGYNILAYNHEGTEICEWLNSIGVSAVLLKYRVPRRNPDAPHAIPLKDAQRAVRLVRSKAKDWKINPDRIGMLGFSAGGHLAVMAGTHFRDTTYEPIDEADKLSCRPDFLIPIYPAYLVDTKNKTQLDPQVTVDSETPPTFVAISYDDADRAIGAALLLILMKQNNVPCELHVYHKGGHGYGMRPSKNPVAQWPQRCQDWMVSLGLLP